MGGRQRLWGEGTLVGRPSPLPLLVYPPLVAVARTRKITETAEAFIESLEGEGGDDRGIGSVVILVEVKRTNEYGIITSSIEWFGDDGRDWLHRAMVEEAAWGEPTSHDED